MILTCPSCGTQYVVKDGAIPPQGRQVRCAACKHSWHQDPEAQAGADEEETIAEAALIDPSTGPEAEERAYEEAALAADEQEREASFEEVDAHDENAAPAEEAATTVEGYVPVEPVAPPAEGLVEAIPAAPPPPAEAEDLETAADAGWRPPAERTSDDDEFSPFAK